MAVIKANRHTGKLEVLIDARNMCAYTINICKNEKNFPKRDRWILTQPIVNEALAVMTCIRRANAIRVAEPRDYANRRELQKEAYGHAEALLTLIDIAYAALGIESHRIEHWTGLILAVEDKLQGWCKSDAERYKDI